MEGAIAALIGLLSFGAFGAMWLFMLGLSVGVTVFWVWMLVDAARRQFKDDNTRLMWVLIVVLGNGIGAAVYYFAGRKEGVLPEPPASTPQPPSMQA